MGQYNMKDLQNVDPNFFKDENRDYREKYMNILNNEKVSLKTFFEEDQEIQKKEDLRKLFAAQNTEAF